MANNAGVFGWMILCCSWYENMKGTTGIWRCFRKVWAFARLAMVSWGSWCQHENPPVLVGKKQTNRVQRLQLIRIHLQQLSTWPSHFLIFLGDIKMHWPGSLDVALSCAWFCPRGSWQFLNEVPPISNDSPKKNSPKLTMDRGFESWKMAVYPTVNPFWDGLQYALGMFRVRHMTLIAIFCICKLWPILVLFRSLLLTSYVSGWSWTQVVFIYVLP